MKSLAQVYRYIFCFFFFLALVVIIGKIKELPILQIFFIDKKLEDCISVN